MTDLTPSKTFDAQSNDGATLRIRQHGNTKGARIIMSHGNGFAMDGYAQFWGALLNDYEVVLYDQRNHGQNPADGGARHHISGLADDVGFVLEQTQSALGEKPTFGVFHSISAVAALWHTAHAPWAWEKLVIIDPPLVPPKSHKAHQRAFEWELFLAGWAMKRPDNFDSPDQLAEQLRQAKGLGIWCEGAFEDMARAMLSPDHSDADDDSAKRVMDQAPEDSLEHSTKPSAHPSAHSLDGPKWRLRCPRELEAVGYISNAYTPVWDSLGGLAEHGGKVLIISGDASLEGAWYPCQVSADLASEFGFVHRPIAGTSHLPQLEQPEIVLDEVRRFFSN